MERRLFLKKSAISACALSLPWQALFSSVNDPHFEPWKQTDEFSIRKLDNILGEYNWPVPSNFNPLSYKSHYKAISLVQGVEQGLLVFEKRRESAKTKYLFQMQRYIPNGFTYTVTGKLHPVDGNIPWVQDWESSSMVCRKETQTPWLKSNRFIEGKRERKEVLIFEKGNEKRVKINIDTPLTWKWGMIDLIPIMAAANIKSLSFATLDETDIIYSEQKARFRKNISLSDGKGGNRKINFNVYDVTGVGVIPTVYWVDEFGRTVFIITGTEGYLLL
ncbi:hypothetical protein [Proteiniphilum sp.]|uniref:hypothetical protein n=1 Tax=Proteiniphilum sp. TaxID=1926877 RepID=UPI0033195631